MSHGHPFIPFYELQVFSFLAGKEKKKRKKKRTNVAIASIANIDYESGDNSKKESGDEEKNESGASSSGPGEEYQTISDTSRPLCENVGGEGSHDETKESGLILENLRLDADVTADSNEPLFELNSGVSLTPVSCQDQETFWAVQAASDEESPGNESNDISPVASELFVPLRKDSPVSRLVYLIFLDNIVATYVHKLCQQQCFSHG